MAVSAWGAVGFDIFRSPVVGRRGGIGDGMGGVYVDALVEGCWCVGCVNSIGDWEMFVALK